MQGAIQDVKIEIQNIFVVSEIRLLYGTPVAIASNNFSLLSHLKTKVWMTRNAKIISVQMHKMTPSLKYVVTIVQVAIIPIF